MVDQSSERSFASSDLSFGTDKDFSTKALVLLPLIWVSSLNKSLSIPSLAHWDFVVLDDQTQAPKKAAQLTGVMTGELLWRNLGILMDSGRGWDGLYWDVDGVQGFMPINSNTRSEVIKSAKARITALATLSEIDTYIQWWMFVKDFFPINREYVHKDWKKIFSASGAIWNNELARNSQCGMLSASI